MMNPGVQNPHISASLSQNACWTGCSWPLGEASPLHAFLAKNPAGGQHHVCFEVPDIHAAKAEFEAMGKRVLGEPRIGAHGTLIFFVHPRDMQGVLTEIMETPTDH